MGAPGTLLIYFVVGVVVAAATVLRTSDSSAARTVATAAGYVVFWPVFLPFLFGDAPPAGKARTSTSRFDRRIDQGERRLEAALASLQGVAEHLLAPERERLRLLGDGLRAMAERAEEMERLRGTPEFDAQRTADALAQLHDDQGPRAESLRARARNVERLERMYRETVEELERALLRVEEIGSQMVLLKFVEDPDREALRLLDELASTVEGATEGLSA